MDATQLLLCGKGEETGYWRDFIARGEEVSENTLTDEQSYRLVGIFMRTHQDRTFARALIEMPVTIMLSEAVFADKAERTRILDDVGSVCLMRAGFPSLVSKTTRKVLYPGMSAFLINMGRSCFEMLQLRYRKQGKKMTSAAYREYIDGFVRMVEVLWAACGTYPDPLEMCETSTLPGASYTKRITNTKTSFFVPKKITYQ